MNKKTSMSIHKVLSEIKKKSIAIPHIPITTSTNEKPFTILIEGNIGSGKTTFIQNLKKLNKDVEIYTEPINQWKNLNSSNPLRIMYENPNRWSLTFQFLVQLTMLEIHKKNTHQPIKIMERSLYSGHYCFVNNFHTTGQINMLEYEILTKWFNFLQKHEKFNLSADLIIYLKTDPEIAFNRIKKRGTNEDLLINMKYIKNLHEMHEDWLIRKKYPIPAPVAVIDANYSNKK